MTNTSGKESIPPIWSKTLGNVSVAIYKNAVTGRTAPLYKITRKRWYVSDGEIKTVTSLFRDDIPCALQLEKEAWLEIYRMQKEDRDKAKATKSKDKAAPASSEDPVLDDEIDAVMAA